MVTNEGRVDKTERDYGAGKDKGWCSVTNDDRGRQIKVKKGDKKKSRGN